MEDLGQRNKDLTFLKGKLYHTFIKPIYTYVQKVLGQIR